MKKGKVVCMLFMAMILAIAFVRLGEAGTAMVAGTVYDSAGLPLGNAQVVVQVRNINVLNDIVWAEKRVMTTSLGSYVTYVSFPDIPEIAFKAQVIVDKGPTAMGNAFLNFPSAPPVNNGRYALNVKLTSYNQGRVDGSIITGNIIDATTGARVSNLDVTVSLSQYSSCAYDSNCEGVYKAVVPAPAIWDAANPQAVSVSTGAKIQGQGISYVPQTVKVTVYPGMTSTVNFYVNRDQTAGYINGTVIDQVTGKPIPFAEVVVNYSNSYEVVGYSTTDFLGRYQQFVPKAYTQYTVKTHGAHTMNNAAVSPYVLQTKTVTANPGEIKKVDFSMVKKLI